MPNKRDKIALDNPFLDRRRKLLPCQEEMVHYWHKILGVSINQISRDFKVNKRSIQFILFPERLKKNKELRADRGGSKIYYNREKHNEAIKSLRHYKNEVITIPVTQ